VVAGSRNLWKIIALGCAPMVVAFVLDQLSLLPQMTTTVSGDALTILPWLVSFSPVPTFTLLLASSIGAVTLAVLTMANVRNRLAQAQREQLLQAWHLRQLVPREQA
jgi:hypothetical protein